MREEDRRAMRTTPRRGWAVLAGALLVLLGVLPARATEPACPAGEITLSAHLLAITQAGAGADRLETASSSFVLPVGVSIDPGSEPVSFVVEATIVSSTRRTFPPAACSRTREERSSCSTPARGAAGSG